MPAISLLCCLFDRTNHSKAYKRAPPGGFENGEVDIGYPLLQLDDVAV